MKQERRSSKLLIDEEPLQVLPTLAKEIGLNRAIFLQQLHYWLKKPGSHERDGRRWVYNTYEQWREQFPFWGLNTVIRTIKSLEEDELILTTSKYNKHKVDQTKWYTIQYEKLPE